MVCIVYIIYKETKTHNIADKLFRNLCETVISVGECDFYNEYLPVGNNNEVI